MRIVGVTLPPNKRIEVALTYIYGIGRPMSRSILETVGIDFDTKVENLTQEQQMHIQGYLKDRPLEGELRREQQLLIDRLIKVNNYRATRRRKGLPARGQRSKTNARTNRRGKKRTIANKKKATK